MAAVVVVGDIDTGLDYVNSSYYQQVWINQGEIPGSLPIKDVDRDFVITFKDLNSPFNNAYVTDANRNGHIDGGDLLQDPRWANGVDEDHNGKTDDLIGWNFGDDNNDPSDSYGHGSTVASIIAPTGGPSAYIVPIRMFGKNGVGSPVNCINYFTQLATAAKSRPGVVRFAATNNPYSIDISGWSSMMSAIGAAARRDILFMAAAGNDPSVNNDLYWFFPANFSSYGSAGYDNVVSVTAIDATSGARTGDFGSYAVDIAATGGATSWSVSYATGAVAAFASANPYATARQIKARLLATSVPDAAMAGKTVTGGKLDQAVFLSSTTVPRSLTNGETFFGTDRSDTIFGGPNDDLLIGHLNIPSARINTTEIDRLTGGAGKDLFVLGNYDTAFYVNGGASDYALITDFSDGDRIGLSGARADYDLRDTSTRLGAGVGIFRKSDDNLIAIVQGRSAGQMQDKDFETVR